MDKYLYRYENTWGAGVECLRLKVIAETDKGCWVETDKRRWVANAGKKRYAYPTVEQARDAFLARKRRSIGLLRSRLEEEKHRLRQSESAELPDDFRSGFASVVRPALPPTVSPL